MKQQESKRNSKRRLEATVTLLCRTHSLQSAVGLLCRTHCRLCGLLFAIASVSGSARLVLGGLGCLGFGCLGRLRLNFDRCSRLLARIVALIRCSRLWACFVKLICCCRPRACFVELIPRFPFSAAQVWGRAAPWGEHFSMTCRLFFELRFFIDFSLIFH